MIFKSDNHEQPGFIVVEKGLGERLFIGCYKTLEEAKHVNTGVCVSLTFEQVENCKNEEYLLGVDNSGLRKESV
jgi:hypothetical protein